MYLHLGQNTVINSKEVIGVFDLDTATVSKRTRDYLSKCEKKGQITLVSGEIPLSFVVCKKGKESKVYFSSVSSVTLQKRINDNK